MKIGILTYHRSHNHGSFLQAYALESRLQQEGYEVEVVNYNMLKAEHRFGKPKLGKNIFRYILQNKQYSIFKKQVETLKMSSKTCISDDYNELENLVKDKYDVIIAGSDEIWKTDSFRGFPTAYWLPGNYNSIKVAYGVSCRSDLSMLDKNSIQLMKEYLAEFAFIGVRDKTTYEQISSLSERNINVVCDPVFLWDFNSSRKRGREIVNKKLHLKNKKKILCYMGGDRNLVLYLKSVLKDVQIISIYEYIRGVSNIIDITSFEWIDIIAAADVMVTSYFHGTCFSIKNNVPFISIDYSVEGRGNSKIYNILEQANLLEKYISNKDENYYETVLKMCQRALNINEINYESNIKLIMGEKDVLLNYLSSISE